MKSIQKLFERFQPSCMPPIPQELWTRDSTDAREEADWSDLDLATYVALDEISFSEDDHEFPLSRVMTLGEYLAVTYTKAELGEYIQKAFGYSNSVLRKMQKHKRVVKLVSRCCCEAANDTYIGEIEYFAGMVMKLTHAELKEKVGAAGLLSTGTAADLVARCLEHIYADCLVPVKRDKCVVPLLLLRRLTQQNRACVAIVPPHRIVHAKPWTHQLSHSYKIDTLMSNIRPRFMDVVHPSMNVNVVPVPDVVVVITLAILLSYGHGHMDWTILSAAAVAIFILQIEPPAQEPSAAVAAAAAAAWCCDANSCPEDVFRLVVSWL
jgi:hypothetical protein